MNDAFGLIQKYTGISKYSRTEVVVLNSTAEEMVGALPDDVFNPDAKFFGHSFEKRQISNRYT